MGFGTHKDGGFNELSKAYKNEPTIENYVRLRRQNPDAEIEIAVLGGIDALFHMEPELQKYGFNPPLIASVMDADAEAISEVALRLMEGMIEARKLERAGKSHLASRGLAIPDKLIDWLINCSLDALSWNDEPSIPRDLIVLIRERLGGSNPEYRQASHAHHNKKNAAIIAGQLKLQGIRPTYKILGNALGVSPSTVKRWFGPGEFEKEVETWERIFTAGRLSGLSRKR